MAGFCLRRGLSRIARRQSARLPGRPGGGGAPSRTFLGRARAFRTTALTQVPEKADEEVEPNSGKPKAILDWRREIYTIPNALTFARIGATPALAYMIVDGGYPLEVFLGCAACGAMDGLDGYIARNFDQASVIGSYIDPLADKILLGGVAGAMAYSGALPLYLVATILGRDVALVGIGLWWRQKTRPAGVGFWDTTHAGVVEMKPTRLSKLNTAAQIALLAGTLAAPPEVLDVPALLPGRAEFDAACAGVVGLTVASGCQYLYLFLFRLDELMPKVKAGEEGKKKES